MLAFIHAFLRSIPLTSQSTFRIVFFYSEIPSLKSSVKTHFRFCDISLFCPLYTTLDFFQHFYSITDLCFCYWKSSCLLPIFRQLLFSLATEFSFFGFIQFHYHVSKCGFLFLYYSEDFLCFLSMKCCGFNFWTIFATLYIACHILAINSRWNTVYSNLTSSICAHLCVCVCGFIICVASYKPPWQTTTLPIPSSEGSFATNF